jgi:hypothetical protein
LTSTLLSKRGNLHRMNTLVKERGAAGTGTMTDTSRQAFIVSAWSLLEDCSNPKAFELWFVRILNGQQYFIVLATV